MKKFQYDRYGYASIGEFANAQKGSLFNLKSKDGRILLEVVNVPDFVPETTIEKLRQVKLY